MYIFSSSNPRHTPILPVTQNETPSVNNNWQSNRIRTVFIITGAFSGALLALTVTHLFSTHQEILNCLYEMYQSYSFKNPYPLLIELTLSEIVMITTAAGAGGTIGATAADRMYENMILAAQEDD